ncbi:MAG: type II toxin-antitoxin system ParD family antitoxin [Gammaproteobacteria bacterium]|nr:type II toxin-antitoxin system ParD family antitoxin [Gammaproteobacteria bacterium]
MNVSLTPKLEDFVKQKVSTGMYNSVSEVIREALRLLEEKEALKAMKLDALKTEIQEGIDSLDNGQGKPLDMEAIKAKGRKIMAQRDN